MSMGAEVDAEVDLGPLVFELMGGLKASLDTLNKRLRNIARVEEAYEFGATQQPIRGVSNSPASGSFSFGLGGPTYGRMWEVKRLVVGGVQWGTSVAGQAVFFVSPVGGQATPSLADVVDQAATLPDVAYYSTRQLVLRHPNRLHVLILSPTASTTYVVGGEATDLPDKRTALTSED
jgi:hypothetical protein